MSYAWIVTLMLHLLPILMIWRTWESDWNAALEKVVRVQIIGSLLYIVVYPIAEVLTWPDFHMGYLSLGNIVSTWDGEGIWNFYKILTAAVVTAVCAAVRRKVKTQ